MSLNRYLKRVIFIPPVFVLAGFVAYAIYERATYKSEWLTAESFEPLELVMVIGHCLLVSCLCLPILLNKRPEVGGNAAWSFLSWFGLPIFYFTLIWYLAVKSLGIHDWEIAMPCLHCPRPCHTS
jgi:hypothetical protein